MAKRKDKLAALESIEAWAKEAKKDIGYLTKAFEGAYHQLQECDNLSDIIDCIQDLDAALESLAGHISHAQDQVNCIKHVINETRTE